MYDRASSDHAEPVDSWIHISSYKIGVLIQDQDFLFLLQLVSGLIVKSLLSSEIEWTRA